MENKRNIRDVRKELSGIDFRLISMAIMYGGRDMKPELVSEAKELEARRDELEKEYPKARQEFQMKAKTK